MCGLRLQRADPEHSERVQPVAANPGASRLAERQPRARGARDAEHPAAEREPHRSSTCTSIQVSSYINYVQYTDKHWLMYTVVIIVGFSMLHK